jgi:hypothetical protein
MGFEPNIGLGMTPESAGAPSFAPNTGFGADESGDIAGLTPNEGLGTTFESAVATDFMPISVLVAVVVSGAAAGFAPKMAFGNVNFGLTTGFDVDAAGVSEIAGLFDDSPVVFAESAAASEATGFVESAFAVATGWAGAAALDALEESAGISFTDAALGRIVDDVT